MFSFTVTEAAAICGGSVYGINEYDPEIKSIVIDSRKAGPGDMFAAYKGENSDGHDYIVSALEKGAACALAEHLPPVLTLMRDGELVLPGPVIVCDDVQSAVEKIAAEFRKRIEVPVIGITGSVGKTTAKEMISSVLSQRFKVHKTVGNLNNVIGLPLSLCAMDSDAECAVLEMGINHFGEMRHLGRVAAPDIAVFTVIGHAHLEFLGDLEGVLRAKTEMLESMADEALVIVNGDDPLLRGLSCRQWKMTFGTSEDCEVRAVNIRHCGTERYSCDITYSGRTVHAEIPGFGDFMIYAALAGAAVGFAMGLNTDEIEQGIASFVNVGRRFAVEDTGYIKLIDDCYNANPDSSRSSIDSMMRIEGRHVCIFGNMLELGENTLDMHRDIGRYARKSGADVFIGVGALGCVMAEEFGGEKYPDSAELIADLPWLIKKGDVVLVKASRGSRLETVSEALKKLRGTEEG